MTSTVAAVGREAAFKDIVRTLQDRKVSAVPVADGGNHVVGVVSEADPLPKEEFRDSDPDRGSCGGCPIWSRPARSPPES